MSKMLKIELSPEAKSVLRRLGATPQILEAIRRTMDKQNNAAVTNIQENHLRGKGPFAVEMHRLGERSHQLVKSVRTAAAVISGDKVISSIGSQVKYAGIHEFGGTISIPAREGTLLFKTHLVRGRGPTFDKRGKKQDAGTSDQRALAKQKGHPNLWVFARAGDKFAEAVKVGFRARTIEMPARAPFSTGIEERIPQYGKALSEAIIKAMEGKQ